MPDGGNPYQDSIESEGWVRKFDADVDDAELIWHKDHQDRIVSVISGSGWFVQLDNSMPVELIEGCSYFIPHETFHRVIKGSGDLVVKIIECQSIGS